MAAATSMGAHSAAAWPFVGETAGKHVVDGRDELLVTPSSVVWSEGGIVKHKYTFQVEEEPVIQALFSCFKDGEQKARRALVAILKTQAHIHFVGGSAHIVHLPFETERAFAAPNGLILQRTSPTYGRTPDVPPNSFASSFGHSRHGHESWNTRRTIHPKDLPRLFSLTDPLEELGLVVASQKKTLSSLSADEDLLYVSGKVDATSALAVTFNQDSRICTLWEMRYIPPDGATGRARSQTRRKVSAMPTPAPPRESFGLRQSLRPEPTRLDSENTKLVASFDPDFDLEHRPGKSSRRISSLVARADLSTNFEKYAFSDMASGALNQASFKRESSGYRTSFGASMVHRVVSMPSQGSQGMYSAYDRPVDDLLHHLNTSGDINGFEGMGLTDPEEGLRKEVIFTRIESFPVDTTVNLLKRPRPLPEVLMMTAPHSPWKAVISVLDRASRAMISLTLIKKSKLGVSELARYNVIDAVTVCDLETPRLLVLTLGEAGPELTLTAPWSPSSPVPLPKTLKILDALAMTPNQLKKREFGLKRVFSGPSAPTKLLPSNLPNSVCILDANERSHTISLLLQPRDHVVRSAIQACSCMLPESSRLDSLLVAWWAIYSFLTSKHLNGDTEWKAFIVLIWLMGPELLSLKHLKHNDRKKPSRSSMTGASGAWIEMNLQEAHQNGPVSQRQDSLSWGWLFTAGSMAKDELFSETLHLAREFLSTPSGRLACGEDGYFPTAGANEMATQRTFATMLVALSLLREEFKLDVASEAASSNAVKRFTPLLAQMGSCLEWKDWSSQPYSAFMLEDVDMQSWKFVDVAFTNYLPPPFTPPSIYDRLDRRLSGIGMDSFLTLGNLCQSKQEFTPKLAMVTQLFDYLTTGSKTSTDIVAYLTSHDISLQLIERFPEGIATPLREALAACQDEPPASWPAASLELVGRTDLKMMLSSVPRKGLLSRWHTNSSHEAVRDVHAVCVSTFETEPTGPFDGAAEADRSAVTRLVFRDDRRFHEAAKLLQSIKATSARCVPEPAWTESELFEAQKEIAQTVALRTLAVSSGRGLLYYNGRVPVPTEKFPISGFNLSCIMKPSNNTVSADKAVFTEEKVCWAFFHAGVSAGLSISRGAKFIDSSWIVFNKPPELSNRHAGFLLALGLNGHLRSMAKWVSFKYLTPKHTMTSIGLLLGLAASHLGTMDTLVARLLSVHVTRMLPSGAAELNLSPLTQTSGIMGIGLLYCGTQHRRMSEIMLSEIEHIEEEEYPTPNGGLRDEGYRLAAGFALGFINIGKGHDLRGLYDMHLIERLLALAVGSKKVSLVHILDKATAAATVAIGLIFMKTHDEALARQVDIPNTVNQFDYVRPDIFLLRTVAKHLIMWNNIQPSFEWMRRNLPEPYRSRAKLSNVSLLDSEDLAIYNVIAGLCFSLALRFAGTHDKETRKILLHYLDHFMRIANLDADTYDQKLTLGTVRNCRDLVALACATVAAGSGDLEIFRRLRSLHGRTDSGASYGSFLAGHIAIGALFLGGGCYTFGTSDLAVGALLCAFYPLFPTSILDNKCHLQAFRHLWVLAVEGRGIVPREVGSHRPLSVPISIHMRNGNVLSQIAPCLLPSLKDIAFVKTVTGEFSSIALDFTANPNLLSAFENTLAIYLRRRTVGETTVSTFKSTVQALGETDVEQSPFDWLLCLPSYSKLGQSTRALDLTTDPGSSATTIRTTAVDVRLVLERSIQESQSADRLRNIKLFLTYLDGLPSGSKPRYIVQDVANDLRALLWSAA